VLRYQFTIDPEDHVGARRLSLRPTRNVRWALAAVGLLLLVLLAADFVRGAKTGQARPLLPMLLGGGVFLLAWYYVLLPRQVRRIYRTDDATPPEPVSGELSAAGVAVASAGLKGALTWDRVERWKHDARLLVLFADDGTHTAIPLRGFATAEDRAAALVLLRQHLGAPAN
jgi:hypothetical protein